LKKVREENRFNRRNACVGSLEKRTFTWSQSTRHRKVVI
jgi:hypothetical protein